MNHQLKFITQALTNIVYPASCCVCNADLMYNEKHICLTCAYDLPYITNASSEVTKLNQLFWGRVEVEEVYSYFNYQKGNSVQRILHEIKYKSKPKVAEHFGTLLAGNIPNSHTLNVIIPVPLHPKKMIARGFNQSMAIAKGLSEKLTIPILEKAVIRRVNNQSQTQFTKFDRYENVRSIFEVVQPQRIINKHILLVDDVLTTGATIEACIHELKRFNTKVSVATLAARL